MDLLTALFYTMKNLCHSGKSMMKIDNCAKKSVQYKRGKKRGRLTLPLGVLFMWFIISFLRLESISAELLLAFECLPASS